MTSSVIHRSKKKTKKTAEFWDKMLQEDLMKLVKERLMMTPEHWEIHLQLQITD